MKRKLLLKSICAIIVSFVVLACEKTDPDLLCKTWTGTEYSGDGVDWEKPEEGEQPITVSFKENGEYSMNYPSISIINSEQIKEEKNELGSYTYSGKTIKFKSNDGDTFEWNIIEISEDALEISYEDISSPQPQRAKSENTTYLRFE